MHYSYIILIKLHVLVFFFTNYLKNLPRWNLTTSILFRFDSCDVAVEMDMQHLYLYRLKRFISLVPQLLLFLRNHFSPLVNNTILNTVCDWSLISSIITHRYSGETKVLQNELPGVEGMKCRIEIIRKQPMLSLHKKTFEFQSLISSKVIFLTNDLMNSSVTEIVFQLWLRH